MKKKLFEEESADIIADFDNDDLGDEDDKVNPIVAAGVFLGFVVLAAIICAVLWNFTHRDNKEEITTNQVETVQDETEEIESPETEIVETDTLDDEVVVYETIESETLENEIVEETEEEPISDNESMEFTEVADTVTAKDVTNLRSIPSTIDAENVVVQLLNGETLSRTGVNDATGWSRLDYSGQTVYAVTQYLTTDLAYKPPVEPGNPNRITTQDGRIIIFTDCDDYVTPKQYVNLRVEPSTSQGEATAKCQISNGTVVHRTGYSPDSGWSRVEYNGEILYVVSSFVYNTDAGTE